MGTTGVATYSERNPSTAEVTVTAGVIMPSASIALAPMAATTNAQPLFPVFFTSEKRAMMPPSPLLSARSATVTYFIVV